MKPKSKAELSGGKVSTMKNPIFKRRIEWLLESPLSEGKTEEELRQNIIDMHGEDDHCIKYGLVVRQWQFDELIDANGDYPEYDSPEGIQNLINHFPEE